MITLTILSVLMVVVGICAGVGWLLAHTRRMPQGEIRAVVGPVRQDYGVDPAALHAAIARQVGRVRGASVARSTPTSHDVNVRPSLARTDDAMGLFVHIDVTSRPGGGAICSMYGQPKSAFAINDSSERALRGFDRDLRMGLKRDEGIRVIDIDGPSTPCAGGAVLTPPAAPASSSAPMPPAPPGPPPFPPGEARVRPPASERPSTGTWWS